MIRTPQLRSSLAAGTALLFLLGPTAGPAAAGRGDSRFAGSRPHAAHVLHPVSTTRPVALTAGRLLYVVRRRDGAQDAPTERRIGSPADLARAQRDERNAWAEPVYPTHAVGTPDDPLYPSQDGEFTAPGDDGFRAAWEVAGAPALGGSPPIIAIVDSGVDLTHPDLVQNLWTNPGEIADNQLDDDHNGYIDDIHGVDIISPGTPPDDDYYHGTAVAGVAAARGDDGQGVTGVARVARIMAVRVLDEDGTGDTGQLAQGILYAVANAAQVLNVSITSDARTRAVDDAIAVAERAGVVIVAAAGNEGRDLAESPVYPASSGSTAVISVAATETRGVIATWSNFGRTGVDVAAPGSDLLTTLPGGSYAAFSGTSAAAPVVTGTIALMRAAEPLAGVDQLRGNLLDTAERSAVPVRSGELRAGAALAGLAPLDISRQALANPAVPYVTVKTSVIQGSGVDHRVRVQWKLARSTTRAATEVLTVRRRTAAGPVLARTRVRQASTNGIVTSRTFRALRGRVAAYVIDVRVLAADGTVVATGRQIRRFA